MEPSLKIILVSVPFHVFADYLEDREQGDVRFTRSCWRANQHVFGRAEGGLVDLALN